MSILKNKVFNNIIWESWVFFTKGFNTIFGNFINRVAILTEKYYDLKVPSIGYIKNEEEKKETFEIPFEFKYPIKFAKNTNDLENIENCSVFCTQL